MQAPGAGRNPYEVTAFTRLARAHLASVAGDALFAMGLAGTIFFLSPKDAARVEVALYLVLTVAPFAVVAPLIGPTLDRLRGGRRWVIFGAAVARAVLCFALIRHLSSWLFYPEAFAMLVASRAHLVSRSALVPVTVQSDRELVEANSKLAILSGLGVVVAVLPGGLLLWLGDARWVLGFAMVVYVITSVLSFKVTDVPVALGPPNSAEQEELRSRVILLAASAMGTLRALVGFVSFAIAFAYKDDSPVMLGIAAASAQVGFLAGALAAPALRSVVNEKRMLAASLWGAALMAMIASLVGGLLGSATISFAIAAASTTAKQSFDAIVQRDAPDANRGRSFARFETRFQLLWVAGGLLALLLDPPLGPAYLAIALAASGAGIVFILGLRGMDLKMATRRRWERRRERQRRDRDLARRIGLSIDEAAEDERADVVGGRDEDEGRAPSPDLSFPEAGDGGREATTGDLAKSGDGDTPLDLEWRAKP